MVAVERLTVRIIAMHLEEHVGTPKREHMCTVRTTRTAGVLYIFCLKCILVGSALARCLFDIRASRACVLASGRRGQHRTRLDR
jgi:hypothetical protein